VDDPRPLRSTYRLQLTPQFGFAAAAERAAYLADLGVSHVYLSPILQAVPESEHGYDVTGHARIRAEFGGEDGFRAMAATLRRHGLGIIADVVPNHMAVHPANRQLWDVLAHGQDSRYAHWFDIDWAAQDGKFLLPILSDDTDTTQVIRDWALPPGQDHYRLAHWRTASTELNWRRFFDVTTLIGIRQEDPDVFAASHEMLIGLHAEGLIDGFRIDHPDGLADPRGYFQHLADATQDAWVVAEKILADGERLPDWSCDGTTGYDTLALVDGLFLDPDGAAPLAGVYGTTSTFAEVATVARREIAERTFPAELTRLIKLLPARDDLRTVLTELLAAIEVYRAYVDPGAPPVPASIEAVRTAAKVAGERLPHQLRETLDVVTRAVLGDGSAELIVRFQQTTGPVQAKGTEDTAGYRWPRLVSLNEVGSDPDRFGVTPGEFHAATAAIAERWPRTLTTLSTHDTKRQEDVRARLAVLAERHAEWARAVSEWRQLTGPSPDPDLEYLTWQTLAGAWPVAGERLHEYLTKAMREAKTRTSWTDPDQDFESAMLDFADRAPAAAIAAFVAAIDPDARVNSLGAKLVQLTMPGIPDTYQGCELTSYALVDPDNRRPVDYQRPRTPLDEEKLLVTRQALRLRQAHPDWFAAGYTPVPADGPAAGHVVAFRRGPAAEAGAVTVATRLPAGLRGAGGWRETRLPLCGGPWQDVLTGTWYDTDSPPLADLTARLPVALLILDQGDEWPYSASGRQPPPQ
jgi:malto-oligosyltrehalose synthase